MLTVFCFTCDIYIYNKIYKITNVSVLFRSFNKASEKKRNICDFNNFFFIHIYLKLHTHTHTHTHTHKEMCRNLPPVISF